ncbi:hypothetical protein PG994_015144 [Apiospora phragmitis]|uniref:Uncharacterized protein n=1 Tax=Apiospora phragmitis TaxID=2905665 RepID=A0ABR1SVY6_9PEZI
MFPNQPFGSDFVPRLQQQQQQQQQQPPPLQNARPRLALHQLRRLSPSPQRMSLPNNSAATSLAPAGSHAQAWQGTGFGHGTAAGLRPANPLHTLDHQTAASGVLEETEVNFQPG